MKIHRLIVANIALFTLLFGHGCSSSQCDSERLDRINAGLNKEGMEIRLHQLEDYHESFPNCPVGTFLLGDQYADMLNDSMALHYFTESIDQNKNDCVLLANSFYGRGNTNRYLKNWNAAIDDLGKSFLLSRECQGTRSDASVFITRALCWVELGQIDSAIQDIGFASVNGDSITRLTAEYSIGKLYYQIGKFTDAIFHLDKYLESEKLDWAYHFRGLSKLAIRDTLGGCLDLQESILSAHVKIDSVAYLSCGLRR